MTWSLFRWFFARKSGGRQGPPAPARVPPGARVYAVGDIHGRSDLLDVLHVRISEDLERAPVESAIIVYVGDYVDRGPDSAGVLDRLCGAAPAGVTRVTLKGNHEAMLLRFLEDPESGAQWRACGGLETLLSYRVDAARAVAKDGMRALAEEFARLLPSAHLHFLRTLKPFAVIGDYYFCHAGVRPKIPLAQQRESDLLWIRNQFLASDQYFGKVIVHGHTPTEEPEDFPNRIGVDTGAFATNRLTCVVLEGEGRRFLSTGAEVVEAAAPVEGVEPAVGEAAPVAAEAGPAREKAAPQRLVARAGRLAPRRPPLRKPRPRLKRPGPGLGRSGR